MGITVNLLDSWEPYRAARTALANTLQPGNIQAQVCSIYIIYYVHTIGMSSPGYQIFEESDSNEQSSMYMRCHHFILISYYILQVEGYLTEGTLTEEYILDNISRLMSCLRECNVTLRWIILHTASSMSHDYIKCIM